MNPIVHSFSPLPISQRPFPHLVRDGFLEPELYEALRVSFPECPPSSGPTGYSYFWGDPEYAELMDTNPAWRALFDRFHSQSFVDYALAQFAPVFREECVHDLSRARYVPYLEDRIDKERPRLRHVVHAPDELWVRVDVMQGRVGYDRGPHLDHRRRAATILLYFCDADEIGMVGGDLLFHHPDPLEAPVALRPRHNRAVMFPCSNASVHSVAPILRQSKPRNAIQVTLSSSVDLWQPVGTSIRARFKRAAAALLS